MMRVILGSYKVALIRLDFGGWAPVRSFDCDMYSARVKYVLGKFWIWAGGLYIRGFRITGKGLHTYIYICMCACVYI